LKRIHRKEFLSLGIGAASALALGCSGDDPAPGPGTGGSGGTGGSTGGGGGAAGSTTTVGGGGSTTGGSGGSATGGGGGSATGGTSAGGGGAGGAGGSGGATGGSGGSGGGVLPAANCGTQLKTFISANHGHTFVVTEADVNAGLDKVYDTKGDSMHEHWVKLTAADFAKLKTGGTVRIVSCNDGHEHEYIVNCLGNSTPDTTSGVANFCDEDHSCGTSNTDVSCPIP
jgi:hypothetical protein